MAIALHRPCRTVRRTSRTEWRLRAELARDHRRHRGDQPDAEDQEGEIEVGAERAGGERVRAEPAQHHHVGRGQRDLQEIGEDDRPRQRQRGAGLVQPRPPPAGAARARSVMAGF